MATYLTVLVSLALFSSLVLAADPPTTWKEKWLGHSATVQRVFFNSDVAIYYDDAMDKSITWPNTYFTNAWKYVKSVYGNFGDENRLYVVLHGSSELVGRMQTIFDPDGSYRSVIDVGNTAPNKWSTPTGWNIDATTHEIAHVVEGSSKGMHESPGFGLWKDSKWAEIFVYDVYRGLGMTSDVTRLYNTYIGGVDDFPRAGTKWFKNWFYPIYTMNGDNMGSYNLNQFFKLMKSYYQPKSGNTYTTRMNMGEFVHFWSGAVGRNLKDQATIAFGWNSTYESQFQKARSDFPNLPYDQFIYFYSETDQEGTKSTQNLIGGCSNGLYDGDFNDQAVSIDTKGQCIRLYDDIDCEGDSIVIANDPRNECSTHFDLGLCGFGNRVTSFHDC